MTQKLKIGQMVRDFIGAPASSLKVVDVWITRDAVGTILYQCEDIQGRKFWHPRSNLKRLYRRKAKI